MSGKGDKFRPVKKKKFDCNFDEIQGWSKQTLTEIRNFVIKKGKKIYKYP